MIYWYFGEGSQMANFNQSAARKLCFFLWLVESWDPSPILRTLLTDRLWTVPGETFLSINANDQVYLTVKLCVSITTVFFDDSNVDDRVSLTTTSSPVYILSHDPVQVAKLGLRFLALVVTATLSVTVLMVLSFFTCRAHRKPKASYDLQVKTFRLLFILLDYLKREFCVTV